MSQLLVGQVLRELAEDVCVTRQLGDVTLRPQEEPVGRLQEALKRFCQLLLLRARSILNLALNLPHVRKDDLREDFKSELFSDLLVLEVLALN